MNRQSMWRCELCAHLPSTLQWMISINSMASLRQCTSATTQGHLSIYSHIVPANSQQDKLLQSPHLTWKASVSNLSFYSTDFPFIWNSLLTCLTLTLSSCTWACTGPVGKGRKAFLSVFLCSLRWKKILFSQLRELLFGWKTFYLRAS